MARILLSLLLSVVLAAFGSSFALAQSDDDPCASDAVAGVSQAEDDEGDDWLGEDDEWLDEEEDFPEDEEEFDDEPLEDEFDEEFDEDFSEDDFEGCEDFLPEDEEEAADDSPEADTDTASDSRTRRGGRGADRFIGDPGVNHFYGRGGNDYLDGAGGRDVLNGGAGDDTILTGKRKAGASRKRASKKGAEVTAGKGNDVIRARNGRVDRIHCGKGRDSVLADRGDRVRTKNCETVRYG